MYIVKKTKIVPYSAKQMYQLVDNIEEYQSFVPWCKHSKELERNEDTVTATLSVAAGGIEKAFTTKNTLTPHSRIELQLVEGPFSHLEGCWCFEDTTDGCKIEFDLAFDINNKLLSMFIGPFFEKATSTMMDIFCEQAEVRYGSHNS